MSNPFDNPEGTFLVLTNQENQHSLWPDFAEAPEGWSTAFGPAPRPSCIEYVEENWRDIRPSSLDAAKNA